MDIKHVVNATAVLTLGKDMVFRDYVQGAFRMRGIANGQKIHLFIIPEVQELIKRQVQRCQAQLDAPDEDHTLDDVVAWLVINSMRTEQMQWSMLCIQNVANIYRKNAFRLLHTPWAKDQADDDAQTPSKPAFSLANCIVNSPRLYWLTFSSQIARCRLTGWFQGSSEQLAQGIAISPAPAEYNEALEQYAELVPHVLRI